MAGMNPVRIVVIASVAAAVVGAGLTSWRLAAGRYPWSDRRPSPGAPPVAAREPGDALPVSPDRPSVRMVSVAPAPAERPAAVQPGLPAAADGRASGAIIAPAIGDWLTSGAGRQRRGVEQFVESLTDRLNGSALYFRLVGDLGLDGGLVEEARRAFQRSCELDPDCPNGYVGLGRAAQRAGDPDEAARMFDRALDLDPWDVRALFDLGVLRMRQERLLEAETAFRKVLTTQPDHYLSRFQVATIAAANGRLGEARMLWEQLTAAEPGDLAAQFNLGYLYLQLKMHAEAAERFETVRAARAKDPDAWNGLGLAKQGLGDLDRALACFQEAYSLAPREWVIINNLADLYWLLYTRDSKRTDHIKEALLLWKQSLGINPNQPAQVRLRALIRQYETELARSPVGQPPPP